MRKKNTSKIPVKTIIDAAGGAVSVGYLCNVSSQAVSQWQAIPAVHVLTIEPHCKYSRYEIRPDIYGTILAARKALLGTKQAA